MDEMTKDERFSHIGKDPRFREIKKSERKVKIDKRFQSMFKDKQFKVKYMVDKRGRPVKTTSSENLKKYYEMSDSESDDPLQSVQKTKESKRRKVVDEVTLSTDSKTLRKTEKRQKKQDRTVDVDEKPNSDKGRKCTKDVVGIEADNKSDRKKKQKRNKDKVTPNRTESSSSQTPPKSSLSNVKGEIAPNTRTSSSSEDEGEKESSEEEGETSSIVDEDSNQSDTEVTLDEKTPEPGMNVDIARGEGVESSSDEEETFEFKEDEFDHNWGEIDKDAPPVEEATARLALCNMDWDRIKANDLMVLFTSFVPAGGVIKEVSIYPSEFGLERMKEESEKGPLELQEKPLEQPRGTTDEDEVSEYHREKLRKYELNRLKYYYAVVVCDSAETGNTIYEHCDGNEYESSSTRLDLRFIPEDMEFDHKPKDVSLKVPEASTYKPSLFANTALQQSNVKLTWDETPHDRVSLTMRNYKADEIEDMDLKNYLASSSEEEGDVVKSPVMDQEEDVIDQEEDAVEENEDTQIQKYRDLLKGIKESEDKKELRDVDMEITWEPGLTSTTKTIVKQAEKEKEKLTPWEKYLDKTKEKKKKKLDDMKQKKQDQGDRRAEEDDSEGSIPEGVDMNDPFFKDELDRMEGADRKRKKLSKKKKNKKGKVEEPSGGDAEMDLLTMDDDDHRQHFSLKKILEQEEEGTKKKRRKGKQKKDQKPMKVTDEFKIKVDDSRFGAIFENPLYNIDPSAPEFKKTKAMEALIEEKQQRRKSKDYNRGQKTKSGGVDTTLKSSNTAKKGNSDSLRGSAVPRRDLALASLVKSVKTKTRTLNDKKTKHSQLS